MSAAQKRVECIMQPKPGVLSCDRPASPLYQAPVNERLQVQLMAEFPLAKNPRLPEKYGVSGSKAVLAVVNGQDRPSMLPSWSRPAETRAPSTAPFRP
jgi:hypothetical protein